eukprot:COSAG01_NODE_1949_length_8821_cov_10.456317_3_plen_235_part_00
MLQLPPPAPAAMPSRWPFITSGIQTSSMFSKERRLVMSCTRMMPWNGTSACNIERRAAYWDAPPISQSSMNCCRPLETTSFTSTEQPTVGPPPARRKVRLPLPPPLDVAAWAPAQSSAGAQMRCLRLDLPTLRSPTTNTLARSLDTPAAKGSATGDIDLGCASPTGSERQRQRGGQTHLAVNSAAHAARVASQHGCPAAARSPGGAFGRQASAPRSVVDGVCRGLGGHNVRSAG